MPVSDLAFRIFSWYFSTHMKDCNNTLVVKIETYYLYFIIFFVKGNI